MRQRQSSRSQQSSDEPVATPTFVRFDALLFKPALLSTTEGLEIAVKHVHAVVACREPSKALHVILKGLFDERHLFEFLYGADETIANFISENILESAPTSTKDYVKSPCASLLVHLEASLRSHHPYLDGWKAIEGRINESFKNDQALNLLSGLDLEALTFKPIEDGTLEVDVGDGETRIVKVLQTQGEKKRAQKLLLRYEAARKVFDQVQNILEGTGERFGENAEDVGNLGRRLLAKQQAILFELLDYLTSHEGKETCTSLFCDVSRKSRPTTSKKRKLSSIDTELASSLVREDSEEFGMRTIKTSILFQTVEKLGPWKVFLSGGALQHLKQHHKSGNLKIITKKIQEISHGFFSSDNQKMLVGSTEHEVPIYEAKMTRDLRLVYQVEMFPDDEDPDRETQGLLIWGVYDHTGLRRRTWEITSKQLQSRGREYAKRCRHRLNPDKSEHYQPQTFPQAPKAPAAPIANDDLTREECLELHNLLALQKMFPLSDHLIESIVKGRSTSTIFGASADELRIIQHPSSCYVIGRSGTGKTTAMLFKILAVELNYRSNPESFPRRPKQLFVTQSRVLAARVQEYYENLSLPFKPGGKDSPKDGHTPSAATKTFRPDVDPQGLPSQLPDTFSALGEEHFPLFLSFDQLCKLFENEFKLSFARDDTTDQSPSSGGSNDFISTQNTASFSNISLSFDEFRRFYWPRLPENFRNKLDPFLVFSEIIGVIKGSEAASETEKGILDEEQYLNLSTRTQSNFAEQRDKVFALFKAYQKLKRENGDFDATDRTRMILREIGDLPLKSKIDFLYVDEVQDHTILDIKLLHSLVRNRDGLCWAGDTAQTIAAGSAFRFDDLKATVHRLEVERGVPRGLKAEPPVFQLTRNYRSHAGIVECASAVVDLITMFWPDSIDRLEKETGMVSGANLQPIFFNNFSGDSPAYMHFVSGEQPIEFGAQQCIIVRNAEARDRLRAAVGEIGIILTIYECKGLEFGDVLLFDFFADSPVRLNDWRLVLNGVDPSNRGKHPPPPFDHMKHRGVGTELKNLYVALTRARSQVWIMDSSEAGEPMRQFWTSRGNIVNWDASFELPQMAVESTPEEWMDRGTTLMNNKKYHQAKFCYQKAKAQEYIDIADAYILRQEAEDLLHSANSGERSRSEGAFTKAADAFMKLPHHADWARQGAQCYLRGGHHQKAGEAYLKVPAYAEAAQQFWQSRDFNRLHSVLLNHRSSLKPDDAQRMAERLKLHFLKASDYKRAGSLFDDPDEIEEFLEDLGLDNMKAQFFVYANRPTEAAQAFLESGETMQAVDVLLSTELEGHKQTAKDLIVEELWKLLPIQAIPVDVEVSEQYLERAAKIGQGENIDELQVVSKRSYKDFPEIVNSSQIALQMTRSSPHIALYVLDKLADTPLPRDWDIFIMDIVMQLLYFYTRQLFQSLRDAESLSRREVSLILGVRPIEDDDSAMTLLPSSPLNGVAEPHLPRGLPTGQGAVVPVAQLLGIARRFVEQRMLDLAVKIEDETWQANPMELCWSFTLGRCNRQPCHGHWTPAQCTQELYDKTINCFYNYLAIIGPRRRTYDSWERVKNQRYWFSKLSEAVRRPLLATGDPTLLSVEGVPMLKNALFLKEWLHDALLQVEPSKYRGKDEFLFIADLMQICSLAFTLFPQSAKEWIFRSPASNPHGRSRFFYRIDLAKNQKYIVHDYAYFLATSNPLYLWHGYYFVRHILDNPVLVDAHDLTCLIEDIVSRMLIQERRTSRTGFHGLLIPRSWFIQSAGKTWNGTEYYLEGFKQAMTNIICAFVYDLFVDNTPFLDRVRFPNKSRHVNVRAMFISRLCRCLAIIGYHMSEGSLTRDQICRAMQRLRPPAHELYRGYANAFGWNHVVSTLRRSCVRGGGGTLDEMLNFSDMNIANIRPLEGVTTISYIPGEDLVELARSHEKRRKPVYKDPREAAKRKAEETANEAANANRFDTLASTVEQGEPDDNYGQNADDDAKPNDAMPEEEEVDPTLKVTEKMLDAADKILDFYRRCRDRPKKSSKKDQKRRNFFVCYNLQKSHPEWNKDEGYRNICLWRLPYILEAVKRLEKICKARKRIKDDFGKDDGRDRERNYDLDFWRAQLSLSAGLYNRFVQLKKQLGPEGDVHVSARIPELEALVLDLAQLAEDSAPLIGISEAGAARAALQPAMAPLRGYFKPKEMDGNKNERPALNADDMDDPVF